MGPVLFLPDELRPGAAARVRKPASTTHLTGSVRPSVSAPATVTIRRGAGGAGCRDDPLPPGWTSQAPVPLRASESSEVEGKVLARRSPIPKRSG